MTRVVAAGVDFRTAPLEVRELVAVSDDAAPQLLRWLIGHAGLSAAAVLSTCHRTELYAVAPDDATAAEVGRRLARYLDPQGGTALTEHVTVRHHAEAIGHLLRVAAGLESVVLGEAQVLAQVKGMHATARRAGTLDARLDYVLRRAVSAGKLVRTRTGIGRGAGSLADVAVDHLRNELGPLRGRTVLVVGAGTMAGIAARRLAGAGAGLEVASRRGESAQALAAEVGGAPTTLDTVSPVAVDAIITCTASEQPVLRAAMLASWQDARAWRPLPIVDLAVPRDVDPAAADVAGVRLVDVDHLQERVAANRAEREHQRGAAEALVAAELDRALAALDERAAAPTIAALTRRAEELRRGEVDRTMRDAEVVGREQVEALTRSLVRKLLHDPIAHLRSSGDDPAVALLVREAFGLDDPEG